MARGVWIFAESAEEAREQIEREAPELRILNVSEIDLSGLPALRSGPTPRQWTIVVEHPDPAREATLPQHEDPEGEGERAARQFFLALATDPDLLSQGTSEQFDCPNCAERIELSLPPSREIVYPLRRGCPKCKVGLVRQRGLRWEAAPPERKRDGTCVFCPEAANSQEHVIPKWISKRLGIREVANVGEELVSADAEHRRRPISFASYRARIFCDGCNAHFKNLEDEVIPLLVPMARGLTLSLGAASQRLLALWATKTAIALSAAESGAHPVPLEHRRLVRREGSIPPNTWVGFFAWGRSGPAFGTAEPELVRAETGERLPGYMAFLTFGQVGFAVLGLHCEPSHGFRIGGETALIRQFAPARTRLLAWPPGSPLQSVAPLFGFIESGQILERAGATAPPDGLSR